MARSRKTEDTLSLILTEVFHGGAVCASARALLKAWRARTRGRQELAGMSDRELSDLGLSHSDAWFECQKPFWRE